MKKLVILCMMVFAVMKANGQTDSVYTYTGIDSSVTTVNDTIYSSTIDQQFHYIFESLDTEYMNTDVLIDRTISAIDYRVHTGDTSVDSACNYKTVAGLICAMNGGAKDISLHPFDSIGYYNNIIKGIDTTTNHIPIMVMAAQFNKLDSMAVIDNLISVTSGQLLDVLPRGSSPYLDEFAFAAAPVTLTFNSADDTFIVPTSLVVSNFSTMPSSITIDFGDGSGAHTVTLDVPIHIHFTPPAPGMYANFSGVVSATYPMGTKRSYFIIKVKTLPANQYGAGQTITWNLHPFRGQVPAGAFVTIALGCGNSKLTKPLIIVKGFDPQNTYHYISFDIYGNPSGFLVDLQSYNSKILNNLIDQGGYDLVYVDFYNTMDSLERNGRVLKEVIKKVNRTLIANGSPEQNIVVGISMGGLIAQWCLRTMENEHTAHSDSATHNAKTYISFDSPHKGAYIPLAAQYLVVHAHNIHYPFQTQIDNFLVKHTDFDYQADIQEPYNWLTSPAAREMLLLQTVPLSQNPHTSFTTDIDSSTLALTPFLKSLASLGYPQLCRNVAIANGSQVQQTQEITPYTQIIGYTPTFNFGIGWLDIQFEMYTLPAQGRSSQIYLANIPYNIFGIEGDITEVSVSVYNSTPYEDAPGGQYSIAGLLNGIPQSIINILNVTYFGFVPTVSSLDLANPYYRSAFYDVYGNSILSSPVKTQFKTYVAPIVSFGVVNESHATFSETNQPLFVNELSIGGGHINSRDTDFIFSGISYNFGANTSSLVQTGDRIGNTDFYSGTSLLINADSTLALSTSGLPNPTHGSNFNVFTSGSNCGGAVTVTIEAGARMIMGNSTYGNTGNFYVDSTDFLNIFGDVTLNPGCHIIVKNGGAIGFGPGSITMGQNCSIVVQKGAIFYTSGGTINLNDTSANIEIDGTLDISSGYTFTMSNTSSGYIKFYQSLADDGNRNITDYGTFLLSGSYSSHKVLEVDGGGSLYPEDYQTMFQIENGLVALGSGSRLNIGCPLTLQNVHINSNTGSYNAHRGLNIYGQPSVYIDSVNVTNGAYGVFGLLFYGGYGVTFQDLSASGSWYSVYTDGVTASFDDTCYISSNYTNGWAGDNMDGGTFERSKIAGSNNYNGIIVNGSYSGAEIYIGQSYITNNDVGCNADNCTLTIDTSRISGNSTNLLGTDATLNLCPTANGGFSDFSGGSISINMQASTVLNMDGGDNNLIPSSGFTINANLNYCPGSTVSYDDNAWDAGGAGPAGTYIANGLTCSPTNYTITDASPLDLSTWSSTYSGLYTGPTSPINRLHLVDTEFNQFIIGDAALKQEIYNGMLAAQFGQYPQEASIFNQCINQYINMGHPDDELLHRMYNKAMEGLHKSINNKELKATDPLVDSVINTQDLMRNSLQASDEYFLRFITTLDKAGLKRAQNNRIEALQILENLETWADPNRLKHLQHIHCIINAEQQILSGEAPKDKFQALVKDCGRDILEPVQANGQVIGANNLNGMSSGPVIYPNPAGNTFNVSLNSHGNSELNTSIIDVNGKVVYSSAGMALNDGSNVVSYPITGLQPGVYVVHLVYNNGKEYREKIVVQNE